MRETVSAQKQDRQDGQDRDDGATAVLGVVTDPGLATELVGQIADELAGLITDDGSGQGHSERWRVETSSQLLPLDDEGSLPLERIGREQREANGWDMTVVVTELPRRAGKQPILADYEPDSGVALVSLPALGAFRLRSRVRDTIVHLVTGHLTGDHESVASGRQLPGVRRTPGLGFPYELLTGAEADEAEAEERRDGAGEEESAEARGEGDAERGGSGVGRHLVLTGVRGRLHLLSGMVRSNRPWRLVPSLSPALAGAAAGAAFGVFYSNIWMLADAFSVARLVLVNAVAVLAMITWLIFDNHLWERPRNRRLREEAVLYNSVTVLTVTFGVACMYVLLFVVTTLASFVAIPGGYLTTTLKHPSGLSDFATIAWLSASMGTLAGALGSGFAGEGAVRRAAYSARERERQARRDAEDERSGREPTRASDD